jgi:hypothetical protein
MDIGSIFLFLALLILVGIFVTRPLFDRKTVVVDPNSAEIQHELSALMAERDRILTSLEELDFDHIMGKIPAEDYPVQRALLLREGAQVLRRLDELEQRAPAGDLEARLEKAIAERRAAAQNEVLAPSTSADDEQVEALLAARRRARQVKSAGFCPQCGRPIQITDRFCPRCGRELA